RAGAGMVRLSTPGYGNDPGAPTEVVLRPLPSQYWTGEALGDTDRFHALVVGPGLGRADPTAVSVREFAAKVPLPLVLDGDGLFAVAWNPDGPAAVLHEREAPTVLTPHDGEFALLRGARVGTNRIEAARGLARDLRCVVCLKGATTVVADPGGEVFVVTAGDERLATAGTGDVLAGIAGALLAQHMPAFEAATAAAWLHGQAARRGALRGLVAGDLPDLLPQVLEELQ
ncbi:MAG TPA: NAD(P)H-hydrate dehydratase, partial [Acidimicrobiales bacterium]